MSIPAPAPSPNKASQLKRPEPPSFSQNHASSPDQSTKKPRLNGANGESAKDIGKGGRWMVEKLEELERLYKAVVKAATVILQYQAFALRLGKQEHALPVHLQRRVRIAWGSYEASRRQVQAYMNDSAQHATTPSSRPLSIPMPLPPTSASLSVPQPANMPLASPIPLAEATLQSFNQTSVPAVPQTIDQAQVPPSIPDLNGNGQPFSFDMLQGQGQGQGQGSTTTATAPNGNGNGMFDMSMEMGDLAAMLQQGSQNFSMEGIMNGTQSQSQVQPQLPSQTSQLPQQVPAQQSINTAIPSSTNANGPITNTNAETDQILAQLGALTDQAGQQQQQQQQPLDLSGTGNIDEDDINALLASLGDVNDQDFGNFDFSSNLDMGNLGEMAGLFNTTTAIETDTKPTLPVDNAGASTYPSQAEPGNGQPSNGQAQPAQQSQAPIPIDLTADDDIIPPPPPPQPQAEQPQPQSQPQPQAPSQVESQTQTQPEAQAQPTQPVPEVLPVPEVKQELPQPQAQAHVPEIQEIQDNEFSGIDMDDFNFGDGDEGQEGMGMSGDEFDRLLAGAFND